MTSANGDCSRNARASAVSLALQTAATVDTEVEKVLDRKKRVKTTENSSAKQNNFDSISMRKAASEAAFFEVWLVEVEVRSCGCFSFI